MDYIKGSYILTASGVAFAMLNGCVFPTFAIFLADMISVLSKFTLLNQGLPVEDGTTYDEAKKEINMLALAFVAIGLFSFLAGFFEVWLFTIVGERITFKLRQNLYKSLVKKDPAFYNKEEFGPGHLASVLSNDCHMVNAIVSSSYGAICKGLGSLIWGITIAFYSSWRIALIGLVGVPLIVVSGFLKSKMQAGETSDNNQSKNAKNHLKKDLKIFQETSVNMRTVSSINSQEGLY